MNIAVILAGGTGSRVGGPLPKQFLSLDGRAVIEHSIHTFSSHPDISEVAVVVHPDWRDRLQSIVGTGRWPKLTKVIDGGPQRYISSLNAVNAFDGYPDDTNLLIHDAARPWVSAEIIDRVVRALRQHEAVGVAIPSTDTIWQLSALNTQLPTIDAIPDRGTLWRAQTPQAFRLPLLRTAFQRALQTPHPDFTDDCSLVRRYMPDVDIAVVMGDEKNRKITFAVDLE